MERAIGLPGLEHLKTTAGLSVPLFSVIVVSFTRPLVRSGLFDFCKLVMRDGFLQAIFAITNIVIK